MKRWLSHKTAAGNWATGNSRCRLAMLVSDLFLETFPWPFHMCIAESCVLFTPSPGSVHVFFYIYFSFWGLAQVRVWNNLVEEAKALWVGRNLVKFPAWQTPQTWCAGTGLWCRVPGKGKGRGKKSSMQTNRCGLLGQQKKDYAVM